MPQRCTNINSIISFLQGKLFYGKSIKENALIIEKLDIIQTFFLITVEALMHQESPDHNIPAAIQRSSKHDSKEKQRKSKTLTMLNYTDTGREFFE
jgi:hypothetical protein